MIPDAELDELERLEREATPGPWTFNGLHDFPEVRPVALWGGFDQADTPKSAKVANARLIAASRNALPDLLAEIRQLRSERSTVRARAIEEAATDCERRGDEAADKADTASSESDLRREFTAEAWAFHRAATGIRALAKEGR